MLDHLEQNELLETTLEDDLRVELEAHEEWGFYVPTREDLIGTTGEFFLHLMMERE